MTRNLTLGPTLKKKEGWRMEKVTITTRDNRTGGQYQSHQKGIVWKTDDA